MTLSNKWNHILVASCIWPLWFSIMYWRSMHVGVCVSVSLIPNKHMKRCATSPTFKKMQIKITIRCHLTPVRKQLSKTQHRRSVGEAVEEKNTHALWVPLKWKTGLARVAQLVLCTKRLLVLFQIRADAPVSGSIPSRDACRREPWVLLSHGCFSLFPFSLFCPEEMKTINPKVTLLLPSGTWTRFVCELQVLFKHSFSFL